MIPDCSDSQSECSDEEVSSDLESFGGEESEQGEGETIECSDNNRGYFSEGSIPKSVRPQEYAVGSTVKVVSTHGTKSKHEGKTGPVR